MDQNIDNADAPQILSDDDSLPNGSHSASPIFLIVGSLLIFVSTAAVLFFNYRQVSKADYRDPNLLMEQFKNKLKVTPQQTMPISELSPTPANEEESAINSIIVDDGSSDFATIDAASSEL